ncbi:lipopolysaccharide biosynthesis protein [Microbacterium flavum]|uniref:lipopolysaccharide biosynthesis protein n=1 Tax=Microbacterium flavum TaxID=415216 RepID=UPI0024ADC607|nr:oligosaccharide flippase family protein [Microbacterium flavum]
MSTTARDAAARADGIARADGDPADIGAADDALIEAELIEAELTASRGAATPSATAPAQSRRSILTSVGGSAAARLVVMPISAVLGLMVTRLIIDNYGEGAYAQYILLVGVAAMIPFADLGLSAAIMNATAAAADPRSDRHLRGVLISCIRILACCASVLILTALAVYALGLWDDILGDGLTLASGSLAATLCLIALGLNLLISFGQRILIALGKNTLVVLLSGLQTPIVLLVLWLTISAGAQGGFIAVASYAATLTISVIGLVLAARHINPTLGEAVRGALRPRERGEKVFDVAWPMLIQMVAVPLATASDRLVLSHLGTLSQLTEYSLAAQMFTPLLVVVATAGMSLWPVFAKARSTGSSSPLSPQVMAWGFAAMGIIASAIMWSLSGLLSQLASGGAITVGWPVLLAFSVFIVVDAAKHPFGMYLTDAPGLRFQAYFTLLLLPINLALTIVLTPLLGAPGPLIGSIVGVVACQLVPNILLVRRRMRRADLDRAAAASKGNA